MHTVTVVYHVENGTWWADSPDPGLKTFVAGSGTLDETRRLAAEGLEFFLTDRVTLIEVFENGTPVDDPLVPHIVVIDVGAWALDNRSVTMPAAIQIRAPQPCPIEARGLPEPVLGAA